MHMKKRTILKQCVGDDEEVKGHTIVGEGEKCTDSEKEMMNLRGRENSKRNPYSYIKYDSL